MLIAEIGSVHDGSFGNAQKLIELASACGADAVKFQTHIAEAESLLDAPSPEYFKDEPRVDYFNRTSFSFDQWFKLKQLAEGCGLVFLSSPFSIEAAELLESIDMAVYKIPSGEITNIPLLEKIATFKKPVLLSSGMSNWNELDNAVSVFNDCSDLTIMQCSSVYPCPPETIGLNVLQEMQQRYGCAVGFSDHSLGLAAPIAAAALGASVIEKHFTFSNFMYGSDAQHSMEPHEFKMLANALKDVWYMLKNPVNKDDTSSYAIMKDIFEKSIVTAVPLKAGTYIEREHLSFKKPGTGIPASDYAELIGKKIKLDCGANVLMRKEWFE
jgi:N,N'-diacetyllegionaminate synthase